MGERFLIASKGYEGTETNGSASGMNKRTRLEHRVFFDLTLSKRAWKHIRERHPEISNYEALIKKTLARPDVVLKGSHEEMKAVRFFTKTHLGAKHIVVVYREEGGQKDIITAYFTSDLKRVKGEPVWKA